MKLKIETTMDLPSQKEGARGKGGGERRRENGDVERIARPYIACRNISKSAQKQYFIRQLQPDLT